MADIRINSLPTTASASSSDDFLALDGATNGTRKLNAFSPTFGGNLTVSGTGTSSFAGPLKLTYGTNLTGTDIGLFATSGGGLYINAPTTKNIRLGFNLGDRLTLDENTATFATNLTVSGKGDFQKSLTTITTESDYAVRIIPSSDDGGLYLGANSTISVIQAIDPNTTWDRNISVQPNGGKFLIGKTIDSTNGKLQLADHTTSAGGIGFGTDTSLYRVGAGNVALDSISGTNPLLILRESSVNKGFFSTSGGAMYIGTYTSNSIHFQTNNTTALTLDSSLNATFAGNVTAIKAGTAFYSIESTVNGALSEVIVKGKNSTGTAREARLGLNKYADDVFSIYDGTTERFRLGLTNGNATITGALAINNTVQTAASVASTHKVTISIGGSTYYLLATNV